MNTEVQANGKSVTVTINGRFTTDEAAKFLKSIEPVMDTRQAEIVVDLSDLDFISSAGIRCFVMLLKACDANGSTLCLKNLTSQLKDIFTLTALIDKFHIE